MMVMGPVLFFRGAEAGAWRLSALVVDRAVPPPLRTAAGTVDPVRLSAWRGATVYRYDFAVPADGPGPHAYSIGEGRWDVHTPAGGSLHLAYTACNGTEGDGAWGSGRERNERWLHLAAAHQRAPFHLLLQGGDQLYADALWRTPVFAQWRRRPAGPHLSTPFTPDMDEAARDFYFESYCRLWAQPELAPVLASIPSLMMWDDHDIVDGWGSYDDDWQQSPVFRGLWSAAREHFALFQLAARPEALPAGFSDPAGRHFAWAFQAGRVGILAPDLRSERNRGRVMGEAGWKALETGLAGLSGCHHVLFLSSVPLVNVQLDLLEWIFALVPGHQEWQDDLIDQWPSLAHRDEWVRLLRRLLAFSAGQGVTVTSLSGEIHLGSLGLVTDGMAEIHQLTSSGIVHPPPPAHVVAVLERIAARPLRAAAGLSARLLPMPGLGRRFLRTRNWLEIEIAADGALAATWHGRDATACLRREALERPSS